jgi:hypothetical protein
MTFETIRGPHELPKMCDQLAREKFFGEVRLIFRSGRFDRIIVEQSLQVNPTAQEQTPNAVANSR